jgi:hypothetical protein
MTKHGRIAAGLCALSVALVFGGFGGPVAAADTEADGSLGDTHGLTDTHPATGTAEFESTSGTPEPGVVGTLPNFYGAYDGETLFGSGTEETEAAREQGHEESTEVAGPMAIGGSTDAEPAVGAVSADEVNNGSDSITAPVSDEMTEPQVSVSHSPVTEPSQEPQAPAAAPPPPVDPQDAEPVAVQSVATEVVPVEETPAPAEAEAAQLIGGAAPAGNIVTALAHLFIALTDDNVSLIQIPNNLLKLLGFSPMGDGTTLSVNAGGIGGSLLAGGLYSAIRTQLASSSALQAGWPEMLRALGRSSSLSSTGSVHSTPRGVGASGVAEQHSVGLKAVLAGGLIPDKVRSIIQHTVDAFLAPLSLLVLAALASPGVTGLVLLGAAGMFVGYRQARAASMLRAVGIARFVKSGPLGVVRSGGLVAVHSRASHRADDRPGRTSRHLETVA